jgi:hypothetical protein
VSWCHRVALRPLRSRSRATRPATCYEQTVYQPSRWTTTPAVWEGAFEILLGPIPTDDLTPSG